MKILKLAMMFAILFATQSVAADGKNKVKKPEKEIQSIQKDENLEMRKILRERPVRIDWNEELDLNEEQSAYVADLYKKSHEKIAELMEQLRDIHRQIDELHKNDEQQILHILNPQQKIKYEKIKRKMMREKGIKPEGPKPSRKRMKEF